MEGEQEKIEESGWNLAQHIIREISLLLYKASQSFVAANFNVAMQNLQAIRLRIAPNLESKELKTLEYIEIKFLKQLPKTRATGFNTGDPKATTETYKLYKEYNDVLMGYLKKYGYLIPPKKDKTRLG